MEVCPWTNNKSSVQLVFIPLASHNGVKSKEKARLSSRIEGPAEGAR